MQENAAIELIEQQQWLDPVSDQLQRAIGSAYGQTGGTGRKVKNFLHGVWLGHPFHPVLTDIPVGAWTAALVMDAMADLTGREEFETGADAAVAIGLTGAVGAALTGLTDWQATDGRARKIGIVHGTMNATAAVLYGASLVSRKRGSRTSGRGLSMLGFAIAFASAYLGGKLVYSEQVGVDHTIGQRFPKDFQPVLADSELSEGQMRRVTADGARILLTRRNGQVYAIAEVCSHMGGPLADGEYKDDGSVTCPWHGSRFCTQTGRVLDGPATHDQPCLNVRVRDGQIEVSRSEP